MQNISQALQSVQSMAAACERVFAFLEAEEMEDESGKTAQLSVVRGDVTFDHVNFGYRADKTIIRDFSAQVKAGQRAPPGRARPPLSTCSCGSMRSAAAASPSTACPSGI